MQLDNHVSYGTGQTMQECTSSDARASSRLASSSE